MKRIVFATFGTFGDVHPYLAIAHELKRRGHRPLIATTDIHRAAVESAGVEFAPIRPGAAQLGDPAQLMRRLFHPVQGPKRLIRELVMPYVRDAYADLDRACAGAATLVTHPLAFAGRLVAEKRGLRWYSTVLAPWSLMSAIDPPLFGPAPWLMWVRSLGVTPYRAVFAIVKRIVGRWEQPLHALRADLGLPPLHGYAQFEGQYAPDGNLALFSRVLAAPQEDWPANTTVCGFSRYDGEPVDAPLQAELDAYLGAGAPPIVFTLGSAVSMYSTDFFATAVEAARRLGQRALLVTGQDPALYDLPAETIKVFRYLPYSAVFPHAAVNVHQCGVGTLAQALAAGKPQLIVPVGFDQPDNARRAVRLGVGRSIPLGKLTAGAMTAALQDLLASSYYATSAAAAVKVVAAEEEAQRAAALLVE